MNFEKPGAKKKPEVIDIDIEEGATERELGARMAWIRSFTEDANTPIGRILMEDKNLKSLVENRMFSVADVMSNLGVMSEDSVRAEVLKKGREIYLELLKQREEENRRGKRGAA